jgi:hypothetical protein
MPLDLKKLVNAWREKLSVERDSSVTLDKGEVYQVREVYIEDRGHILHWNSRREPCGLCFWRLTLSFHLWRHFRRGSISARESDEILR